MKLAVKVIIAFQLILISFLLCKVFLVKKESEKNVSMIDKNIVEKISTDKLKYFYDFKPNEVATWSADFLKMSVVNKHNADGFNDTYDYEPKKESGVFRLAVLGDSFAYGYLVNTKNNWTEILESKLNSNQWCKNIRKFEVINMGVPGYDPEYTLEQYKEKGAKYNPDFIVWILVDPKRINEMRTPLHDECLKLHNEDNCWTYAEEKIASDYGMPYIYERQRKSVMKLRDMFQGHILFVDFYGRNKEIIEGIKDTTDFDQIFTNKYLLKNNKPEELRFPDYHPNNLGHKLIAETLFNKLINEGLIQCARDY